MRLNSTRPFRKNLNLQGLIYLNEEERNIIVKTLSLTGLLVELDQRNGGYKDISEIFNSLLSSTLVDIFVPSLRMAGETEVIRADLDNNKIRIALEFKSISYDVEDFIYRRKEYRKTTSGSGHIRIDDAYYPFRAVNASLGGLMIHISRRVVIERPGINAYFEFHKLGLAGKAQIIWSEYPHDNETFMGLRYVHLDHGKPKGLPIFADR